MAPDHPDSRSPVGAMAAGCAALALRQWFERAGQLTRFLDATVAPEPSGAPDRRLRQAWLRCKAR